MKTKTLILFSLFSMSFGGYAQNQVLIPDTLSGTSYQLTLQNGTIQFLNGQLTNTMGVNGNILGPTLIMEKGDDVDISVENLLGEETTIHWHGMHVSASNDGGPHTVIDPGETWNPSFTVMDRAATYWYHPHLHEKTNEHVTKGIAGFIIVRDEDEAALDLPRTYGVDDFPLVIQTKDFDANNQVIWHSNSDNVLMVNATIDPVLDLPAQVVRLRLLNGSSQRFFNLGLSGNEIFYQIASDDGLLSETNAVSRLQVSPGARVELLLDLTGLEGQSLHLMSYAGEFPNGIYGATYPGLMSMMTLDGYNPNPLNGANFNIIEFNVVEQNQNPATTIPTSLVEIIPLLESEADITRNLTFTPEFMGPNSLNGRFYINGTLFDMNTVNYTIPLDNIEIWSLTNQSPTAHPFHIHDVHFYILDRNGNPPPVSEQGRKDVVYVPAMSTVRFITQFTDYANDDVPYMYHCHMLVHEDDGMMGQFKVVDNTLDVDNYSNHEKNVILYPNPINDEILRIEFTDGERMVEHYEIVSSSGKQIVSQPFGMSTNNLVINLSSIENGQYWIRIKYIDKIITKTFIKN